MKTERHYDVLFIDLDDTLYDFSANSTNAYREVYPLMGYDQWFDGFDHYNEIYRQSAKPAASQEAAGFAFMKG